MRNILITACILFSVSIFSQEDSTKDSIYVPKSIFAVNSLFNQQNNGKVSPLRLTGHKFLIVDFFNDNIASNNLHIDFRNIGRRTSVEDIIDNNEKAWLNRYDVSRNANHFIWNVGTVKAYKQRE